MMTVSASTRSGTAPRCRLIALTVATLLWPLPISAQEVPRFGIFEQTLEHGGRYDNPYRELIATAELTEPDGRAARSVPLFWDGGSRWTFRFSPDKVGGWAWRVTSRDHGLDGRSGRFRVVPSDRAGSIRPMKGHPYHFERQDGSAFWFMGDTAWALYTDSVDEQHNRAAVEEYIDTRAEQGFNVVHSMLLSEAGWGNHGGPPFHAIESEEINPAYWQEVDRRIAYVNRRGLIAGLALAWADKRRVEPYAWRRFPSIEARKRYARFIAARFGAFDVYFIVSGEWHGEVRTREDVTEAGIKREFVEIGNALAEADPHKRMMAIHPMTRHGSVREFVGTEWMTFGDYQQNYRELHHRLLQSRRFNRPVVNSEYGYFLRDRDGDGVVDKNNSFDVEAIRHASWDLVMAGGYFVTGFGTTYFGGNRDPGPFDPGAKKNDVWEAQIQHIPKLFTALDWWTLTPADDAITSSAPRSDDGMWRGRPDAPGTALIAPPKVAYWMLTDANRTSVAYVRGSDATFTIRLRPGAYRVRQFDPRTGTFRALGETGIGEAYTYHPPDTRDWVVVFQKLR